MANEQLRMNGRFVKNKELHKKMKAWFGNFSKEVDSKVMDKPTYFEIQMFLSTFACNK